MPDYYSVIINQLTRVYGTEEYVFVTAMFIFVQHAEDFDNPLTPRHCFKRASTRFSFKIVMPAVTAVAQYA